jgi:hypothetical protein
MDSTQAQETSIASAGPSARPFVRVFNRIFSRHVMNMAVLAIVPIVFSSCFNKTLSLPNDPDIWWHLADARILSTSHHFIRIEPYAFTVAGERWINPEWLSELPYWFSYQAFQLRGLYFFSWLAFWANILLVYWRGYLNSRHAGAAFWAACLGFVLMTVNAGPRMIIFGYLAMSCELLILEASERGGKRALWLLPPLFCVWINLHGTWLIGIALLALYILCGLFRVRMNALEQDALPASDRSRLLAVFGASLVALFVNPYGWELVWNPLDMVLNQTVNIATVSEWQPLKVGSLEGAGALAGIGLMVLANCVRGRKWKLFELAVVFFAWYAAFAHVRFLFLAAVLTVPILAVDFERSFCIESDEKTIPALNALITAGAVCFVVFMFPSEARLQEKLESSFPLQTIRSIQPAWRTFNWDYAGGRMAFEAKSAFVDSRIDTFEHHGVFQDYLRAMNLIDSLEVLDRYRIDHVLVLETQPISYLLKHTPGWRVTKRENCGTGHYVMYTRLPFADGFAAGARAPREQRAQRDSGDGSTGGVR